MADTFRIERSISVRAAPAAVFPLVADFHRWRDWSPWEAVDSNLKRTYSGAEAGRGAVYAWEGNAKAGAGRMEIVEAAEPSRIAIRLDFSKPMRARNTATFSFTHEGGGTRVDWRMEGPKSFMFKVMSLFMSMDRMIGKDFERGLEAMKVAAESSGSGPTAS